MCTLQHSNKILSLRKNQHKIKTITICETEFRENVYLKVTRPDVLLLKYGVAVSIAFSIRHKFELGFPCLSHSLCLLCFDVSLFSVVSRAPRLLLIDFR